MGDSLMVMIAIFVAAILMFIFPLLSLSERNYKCDVCGLKINRDLNASINLKNYKFI